jgi:transposase-like protein
MGMFSPNDFEKRMSGRMTVAALADRLGINRSHLHKRVRREGVKTIKVPCMTGGGLQLLTAVPTAYAERLIRQYEEAQANSRKVKGSES